MPDPTVKMVFSGNSADAERVIVGLEKKYDSLENKLRRLSEKNKQQAKDNPFKGAEDGLVSLLGRLASFSAATTFIKQSFADIEERGRKAFERQQGQVPGIENLAVNLPPDVALNVAKSRAEQISRRTGVDRDTVMRNLASGFSAMGNLPSEAAFRSVEAAAALVPNLPEFQETLSGSILDIRKYRPDVTESESLGMLRKAQRMSRITDFQKFAENLAPGALSASMFDKQVEQNLALGAAMTQIGIDPRGEQTRTAMIALVNQARGFFGAEGEGKTNQELLAMLGDAETRKLFFEGGKIGKNKWAGASFEKRFEKPVEEMLTPGTEAHKILLDYQKNVGTFAQAEADYKDLVQQLSGDPEKRIVDRSNRRRAIINEMKSADTPGASWASGKQDLDELMEAAGMDLMDRFAAARRMDAERFIRRASPEMGLERTVRMVQQSLEFERKDAAQTGYRTSEETTLIIKKLDELIEDNRKNSERQIEEQRRRPVVVQGQRE